MIEQISSFFNNFFFKLLSTIIILLIGMVIGKIFGRFVRKALSEIETNKVMKIIGLRLNLEKLLANLTSIIVYLYSFYLAISQFGITNLLVYSIGIIILLIISISFLLSIREFVPNMVEGFIVRKKLNIKVGKEFKHNNILGKIEKITIKDIRIKTSENELIFVPYTAIKI